QFQLSTSGGQPPYSYSQTPASTLIPGMRVQDGPPLPNGFTATGGYLGLITNPSVPGDPYTTSIRVTDSVGATFDRTIYFTVSNLAILSQGSLPRGTVGTPYLFTFTGSGGGSEAWSATILPPGLSINSAGVVSGTPTAAGSFTANITITDLT